jgi:hypothetical protein
MDFTEIRGFILSTIEDVVKVKIAEIEDELDDLITFAIDDKVEEMVKKNLKGEKGKDGMSIRGQQGFPGKDGRNGVDGKDADEEIVVTKVLSKMPKPRDGSPDTPDQIATKLNTLKEKVKQEVIIGLADELEKMRVNIKSLKSSTKGGGKGGGGSSNVVPETFSIGASTTSVTLANTVASAGKAIWVSYQGQALAYGTHFTVAGNVVTLLFTPNDSTFLDIIYIR